MGSHSAFHRAVVETPAPPCDGCPYTRRCAEQLLVCDAYVTYLTSSTGIWHQQPGNPSRLRYDEVFGGRGTVRRFRRTK